MGWRAKRQNGMAVVVVKWSGGDTARKRKEGVELGTTDLCIRSGLSPIVCAALQIGRSFSAGLPIAR